LKKYFQLKMADLFECPHCGGSVQIIEINCGIFRHAIYLNGQQIDPHAPKELCDRLVRENLVIGCARPFIITDGKISKCDYI
jgi:hypothetical protein